MRAPHCTSRGTGEISKSSRDHKVEVVTDLKCGTVNVDEVFIIIIINEWSFITTEINDEICKAIDFKEMWASTFPPTLTCERSQRRNRLRYWTKRTVGGGRTKRGKKVKTGNIARMLQAWVVIRSKILDVSFLHIFRLASFQLLLWCQGFFSQTVNLFKYFSERHRCRFDSSFSRRQLKTEAHNYPHLWPVYVTIVCFSDAEHFPRLEATVKITATQLPATEKWTHVIYTLHHPPVKRIIASPQLRVFYVCFIMSNFSRHQWSDPFSRTDNTQLVGSDFKLISFLLLSFSCLASRINRALQDGDLGKKIENERKRK